MKQKIKINKNFFILFLILYLKKKNNFKIYFYVVIMVKKQHSLINLKQSMNINNRKVKQWITVPEAIASLDHPRLGTYCRAASRMESLIPSSVVMSSSDNSSLLSLDDDDDSEKFICAPSFSFKDNSVVLVEYDMV